MNCLFCLIILFDITSILIIEFWISDSHHHLFLASIAPFGFTTKFFYLRVITKSILLLVYTLFRDDALFENFTCAAMYGHLLLSCMMSPGPFHYGPPQLLHAWSRTVTHAGFTISLNSIEWPYHAHYSCIGHTCTIIHLSCHSPISAFIIFYHHGVCD